MDEERAPLDEHEELLGAFTVGRGQVGQQFVVTNRRLVMAPLAQLKDVAADVATWVATVVAGTRSGSGPVGEVLQSYAPFEPRTVWLRQVLEVRAGNNGGILKAPQLVLVTDSGVESLGVVRGRWSPGPASGNVDARDELVQVLVRAVADARSAAT